MIMCFISSLFHKLTKEKDLSFVKSIGAAVNEARLYEIQKVPKKIAPKI